MADCSLYEIHAFSNIFLRYPGRFPIVQNSQAQGARFAFADNPVCIFSRVHRVIPVFRAADDEKCGAFFRTDLPAHALMRHRLRFPSVRISVVVPLRAHYECPKIIFTITTYDSANGVQYR